MKDLEIVIEKGEDGYFVAHALALKGCWSQGKTREEAEQNIQEAIGFYMEPDEKEFLRLVAIKTMQRLDEWEQNDSNE